MIRKRTKKESENMADFELDILWYNENYSDIDFKCFKQQITANLMGFVDDDFSFYK